ncbi:hypothetical protein BDW42DRAFT_93757 [Aspergillus taichungensis]|uniref:Glycosyl hydrolase family 43 protein n=1 Tax=Aspergillus taichungensis TaxID=482145 RepID=A0A2J5I8J8_9EURO|nr:hypothetical protein BDW42DRAFT_93757 [Aspergillus taichungensis]
MLLCFNWEKKRSCTAHDQESSSGWSSTTRGGLEEPTRLRKLFTREIARRAAPPILFAAVLILMISIPFIIERAQRSRQHDDPSYHNAGYHPINVLDDFPNPGMAHFNGTWVAYGTDTGTGIATAHVPVATSDDFIVWRRKLGHDALPTLGGWEKEINHWGPDVIQRVSSHLPPQGCICIALLSS